ncbi:MAG: hypothetical protein FJW30_22405 [Acidobacteria bacterium]|nr:hypothetical protein [Acidobacteriota bacterium]
MPIATNIDDVIATLTNIIDAASTNKSRLGYFPALYRLVTRAVKAGIAGGRFQNGPLMEQLDVHFANRYLQAYEDWQAGRPVSACWKLAFDVAGTSNRIILQHLLLGMNAHINLDLAVSAAETAPGAAIGGLQHDFNEINAILNEQIEHVQDAIASVSAAMWVLDTVGGRTEERIVEFSLSRARDAAWRNAQLLAKIGPAELPHAIGALDTVTERLGKTVADPPGVLVNLALWWVVRQEDPDVRAIIAALAK